MKKILSIILASALLVAGCARITTGGKKVLCGSTIILSLVKDCGKDIDASTLIPSDVCPGSFDLKPEDAAKVASASVFIIQPFQLPLAEKVLKINPKITVETLKTADMTTPENYFRGMQEAAQILGKYFPEMSGQFSQNINSTINSIRNTVINDMEFIQGVRKRNIKALVSNFHVATANYMGLVVAGIFAGPEFLKPVDIKRLISTAKSKKVGLIVSNLTGTHDATAEILNKNLKTKKAVFIVFPAETAGQSMFISLWEYNISQLKNVLGE